MSYQNKQTGVRVISQDNRPFIDRIQAGELLANELGDFKGKRPVVLGIPRGGVVIASVIAKKIEADLDIVLSRKLGTPGQPELAMGAIAEDGQVFLNSQVVNSYSIPDYDIQQEKTRQMQEIKRRSLLIRCTYPKIPLKDRTVLITDDGVATGATMQAAIWVIRREMPAKLITAVPVASGEAVARIAPETDELICLKMPPDFAAVGQFYYRFEQISDKEVLDILTSRKKE